MFGFILYIISIGHICVNGDFISSSENNDTVTQVTGPFDNVNSSDNLGDDDYTAEYFKNRILNEGFADEDALRKALERSIQESYYYCNNLQ